MRRPSMPYWAAPGGIAVMGHDAIQLIAGGDLARRARKCSEVLPLPSTCIP
jgi:hypothetical protein